MDKKPKLFSFSRETEINHVNAMIKDTIKRELLYSMVDSFIEIIEKEKIIKETLDPFIQGLKTNDKYVWEVAGDRLVMLAHHYQEAEYELRVLAKDKSSGIRFRVIACLDGDPPLHLAKKLLQEAIEDKSSRVRIKAAYVILELDLKELLHSIQLQLEKEKNTKVKDAFIFTLKNLK